METLKAAWNATRDAGQRAYAFLGPVWTLILIALVVIGLLYVSNKLGGVADHLRWWNEDRQDAKSDERIKALETEMAARDATIAEQNGEINEIRQERDALKHTLADLTGKEAQIDKELDEHRTELDRIREGGDGAPVNADDLYNDLRRLYPPGKRRPS